MKKSSNTKLKYFGLGLFLAVSANGISQTVVNGFYPKKNDVTVAVSYGSKSNTEFFRGTKLGPNPASLGTIESSIVNLYAEYGINDWLSATATLPYITVNGDEGRLDPILKTDKEEGLQDLGLYLKGKIYETRIKDGSSFKLGSAISYSFPISNYEGAGVLSLGNSANDFSGTVIAQYTLPFNLFAEIQGGYSFRNSSDFDIPNATLFTGKLGYYNDYFYIDTVLGVQNSQSGLDIATPEFAAAGGPKVLPETDVDYTQLTLNLYVPFYKNMLGASAGYGTTLEGRNYNDISGFSLGLVYTLR